MSISKVQITGRGKFEMISPWRLAPLLRLEKDPKQAFELFMNPNPYHPSSIPFRYSQLAYGLIINKLGWAKMFDKMEMILDKLKSDTRIIPKETILSNAIHYYGRARLLDKAHHVFDQIYCFRIAPTIVSFNALLNGYMKCKKFDKMDQLIVHVNKYGSPDAYTFNILINACFLRGVLDKAWWGVLLQMQRDGVQPNVASFSILISLLCRNSRLEEAFKLETEMVTDFGIEPSISIYASLIKGLCDAGKVDEGIKLKEDVMRKGYKLNSPIYTTLIGTLFREGRKWEADKLRKEMEQNGCKMDRLTYNAMISGCCMRKEFDAAFNVLNEMEKKEPKPDVVSYNIIIRGLCGEGKLFDAVGLFEDMPRRKCMPDEVTYRALIDGLREGYMIEKAVVLLDEMVGKGYLPRTESINRLVDLLIREQKIELLWEVLYSLGKVNGIDYDVWRSVVYVVCGQAQAQASYSSMFEVVDSLVMEPPSRSQGLKGQNQSLYE